MFGVHKMVGRMEHHCRLGIPGPDIGQGQVDTGGRIAILLLQQHHTARSSIMLGPRLLLVFASDDSHDALPLTKPGCSVKGMLEW